jgi:hypothetical protein
MNRTRILKLIPYGISGFYFIISNVLFLLIMQQGSELLYAFLVLSTFPYGPYCREVLNHLDSAVFIVYDLDKRNVLRYTTLYIMLVVGGALWYWLLAKYSCWFVGKYIDKRNK